MLKKTNKFRVAIMFGGCSTEHKISIFSSMNIVRFLNRNKYDVILIGIDKHGRWILFDEQYYLKNIGNANIISSISNPHYLSIIPGRNNINLFNMYYKQPIKNIDVIFSVLHGGYGENGSIQGLLNILRIPYVGSGVLGSAICMDKDITKRILHEAHIDVVPFITLFRHHKSTKLNFNDIVNQLGLPLFIKPASQGSSIGVTKVENYSEFNTAIKLAFSYENKILIEKAIIGKEIEIAILGNSNPQVSVCGEIFIDPIYNNFYTYENKYTHNSKSKIIIPASLTKAVVQRIEEISKQAYKILNCHVMARIDFLLTEEEKIFINEVNTLPGFTTTSMYPKLWKYSGLDYTTLIEHLIMFTLDKNLSI